MFQNGISQNTKCAVEDGFRRDSHIYWISCVIYPCFDLIYDWCCSCMLALQFCNLVAIKHYGFVKKALSICINQLYHIMQYIAVSWYKRGNISIYSKCVLLHLYRVMFCLGQEGLIHFIKYPNFANGSCTLIIASDYEQSDGWIKCVWQ